MQCRFFGMWPLQKASCVQGSCTWQSSSAIAGGRPWPHETSLSSRYMDQNVRRRSSSSHAVSPRVALGSDISCRSCAMRTARPILSHPELVLPAVKSTMANMFVACATYRFGQFSATMWSVKMASHAERAYSSMACTAVPRKYSRSAKRMADAKGSRPAARRSRKLASWKYD